MIRTINQYDFIDAFRKMGREESFSYNGLVALYEYLEMLEDDLGQEIELDVIRLYNYEDLPPVFKRYITYRASRVAATQLVANPQLVQLLAQQESLSRAALMEYECNQGNHSMLGFPDDTVYPTYEPWRNLAR